MSTIKENAEAVHDNVHALIENQAAYYKLWSFKVAMKSITLLIHAFLIALFSTLTVLFISIAAALLLGDYLHNHALGFLIVSGFYLMMCLLAYLLRDKINRPILEKFSSIFFAD
jgi:succinate-acetate transporter protein